jgi:hypothetical protein
LLLEAKSIKTTQRGSSGLSPLRLDGSRDGQAGGWTGYPVAAQGLYSLKLQSSQGGQSDSSPLGSDGSHDSQAGGWTSCLMDKDAQMRVGNISRQPRDLSEKRQSDSLKEESA